MKSTEVFHNTLFVELWDISQGEGILQRASMSYEGYPDNVTEGFMFKTLCTVQVITFDSQNVL